MIPDRVWKCKLSCGKLPDGKFAFKLSPMRLYTQFACFSGPNQTGSLISVIYTVNFLDLENFLGEPFILLIECLLKQNLGGKLNGASFK